MNRNIFKLKMERFETIWFTVALLALILSSFLLNYDAIGIIATITGMINVLLVAKRSIWNYFFGIIYVVLYAYISYISGYGGDFMTYVFYYFPLQFVGIYTWMKHMKIDEESAEVIAVKLSKKGWIILIINLIIGTFIVSKVLPIAGQIFNMEPNPHIYLDAFTTYAGITAGIMMAKRYTEQWHIWILVNVGSVLMWISMLGKESTAPAMIIMWSAYLVNAIYGLYKWSGDKGVK